jgi:hypothetical protein
MNKTTRYPGDQEGVVDLQLDGVVKLLFIAQHVIQTLSLSHGTREAVQDESAA